MFQDVFRNVSRALLMDFPVGSECVSGLQIKWFAIKMVWKYHFMFTFYWEFSSIKSKYFL